MLGDLLVIKAPVSSASGEGTPARAGSTRRFPKRRLLLIWAGMVLIWFLCIRVPHPPGDDDVAGIFFAASYILGTTLLFLVATLWTAFVDSPRSRKLFAAGLLLATPPWAAGGLAIAEDFLRDFPLRRDVSVVATALERYRAAEGRYPVSLHDLVPGTLNELPPAFDSGNPYGLHDCAYSGHMDRYAVGYWTRDWRLQHWTHQGWVDSEPDWMFPLPKWEGGYHFDNL